MSNNLDAIINLPPRNPHARRRAKWAHKVLELPDERMHDTR